MADRPSNETSVPATPVLASPQSTWPNVPTAHLAVFNEAMEELVREGLKAQRVRNGRELAIFEHDFDRIALLADALIAGNYRDTAALGRDAVTADDAELPGDVPNGLIQAILASRTRS